MEDRGIGEIMEGNGKKIESRSRAAKKFDRRVIAAGFLCAALATIMFYGFHMSEGILILSLPPEIAGKLLRWLSLSGAAGNIMAWVVYAGLCSSPLLYLLARVKGKQLVHADLLLPLISAYSFYMLYCFINPGVIDFPKAMTMTTGVEESMLPVMKMLLSMVLYSLLAGYLILLAVHNFRDKDVWRRTQQLLALCAFGYVIYICYFLGFDIMTKLSVEETNALSNFLTILMFLLELLPLAMFVGIISAGITLLRKLRDDRYGEDGIVAAGKLATVSRNTAAASVICGILKNIIQITFMGQIDNVNIILNLPLLPLILAFAGLIISEYLTDGSQLSEDSNMII